MRIALPGTPLHKTVRRVASIVLAVGLSTAVLAGPATARPAVEAAATAAPAAATATTVATVTAEGDATGMIRPASYAVPKVSGTWFDRARAYLDLVGGKGYQLVAKEVGTASNPTASDTRGTIYVGAKFDKLPHATKLWLMAMRTALQKQYEIAPSLETSAAFKNAGSDRSHLAWCMAIAKNAGFKTSLKCTPAQKSLALAVWTGRILGITTVKHVVAEYTQDGSPLAKPAATSDWMKEARSYMNVVGGSAVKLASAKTTDCNGSKGCMRVVNGAPTVFIRGDIWKTMTHRAKTWLVMHEVAHTYQGKVIAKINASKTYAKLFPKDMKLPLAAGHTPTNPNFPLEHLANCMTMARGVVESAPMCTPAQISFAAGIWKGAVQN